MRKFHSIPALLAAALLAVACHTDRPQTSFDGTTALTYAKAQLDFGTRIPNSLGAQRAGDWIVAQMKSRADTVIEQRFDHVTVKGDTLHLRNILARIHPAATQRVLYLTHWDTRPISDQATRSRAAQPANARRERRRIRSRALRRDRRRAQEDAGHRRRRPAVRRRRGLRGFRHDEGRAPRLDVLRLASSVAGLQAAVRGALGHDRRQGSRHLPGAELDAARARGRLARLERGASRSAIRATSSTARRTRA